MSFLSFFVDHKWVLLFYGAILLLLFIFRKKFVMQSKIVAMYKTRIGLSLMDRIAAKHGPLVRLVAYIGIGVGFVGMIVIFYTLVNNLFTLLTVPKAQSAVSVIIPGVSLPGSPIVIPLIAGWIALFFVIVVHEFSHGVVARAHKIPIKSSGIFFLGPLMGAFVEPEEKKLQGAQDTTQYAVYAAGPFSNILLALIALGLIFFIVTPLISAITTSSGVTVVGLSEGFPAQKAGLVNGMEISAINEKNITTYEQFQEALSCVKPNQTISLIANHSVFTLRTAMNPENSEKGYLGILTSSVSAKKITHETPFIKAVYNLLMGVYDFLFILFILSFGIGLANLLPLGPVDGGRMCLEALTQLKGKEKGMLRWKQITIITFFILLINIFWPLIAWFGNLIGLMV